MNHRPLGPLVDAAPARRPGRPVLEGRFVRLEPLDPARHGDDLWAASQGAANDALWDYLFIGPFAGRDEFDAYLAASALSDDPLFLAIIDKATGQAVGWATYMRIAPDHRVIEVGNILFAPALQRTAGATEAMVLMARHAFEDLGYRRYEWKCNALNGPSMRAAERLGFAYEGTFRSHMIVKGRSRDTAWFAMTEEDWPGVKAAFERWLAPDNFDGEGRQRERLTAFQPGRRSPA